MSIPGSFVHEYCMFACANLRFAKITWPECIVMLIPTILLKNCTIECDTKSTDSGVDGADDLQPKSYSSSSFKSDPLKAKCGLPLFFRNP